MFLEMFRFARQRRLPYSIFAFGAGKSLKLDLGVPKEVDDQTGYKVLAENSFHIRQVEAPKADKPKKKKSKKPKYPEGQNKMVGEDQILTS